MMRFSISTAIVAGAAALFATGATAAGNDEPQAEAGKAKGAASYQETATGSCSGGTCTAQFPKAKGGKVLETTNLSCLATATGFNAPPYATFLAAQKPLSYLPLLPYAQGGNSVATGALGGTTFVPTGQAPSVVVAGSTSLSCTLSGRLIAK